MELIDYLGKHVSLLTQNQRYRDWPLEISREDDLEEPIIFYLFNKNGLELQCDNREIIKVIMLYPDEYGGIDDSLFEVPVSSNRKQIRKKYGAPTKNGEKRADSILGKIGPWDRYDESNFTIHFEYKFELDVLKVITLMTPDRVPK